MNVTTKASRTSSIKIVMQRDAIDEDYSIRLVLQFQTKTIKFKVELQEQPINQNRTKKDMGNYVKHI